jgi:hypothetical protein
MAIAGNVAPIVRRNVVRRNVCCAHARHGVQLLVPRPCERRCASTFTSRPSTRRAALSAPECAPAAARTRTKSGHSCPWHGWATQGAHRNGNLQGVPSLGVARYAFSRAMEQFDETAQRKLAAHYKALVVQVPLRRYATVPRPSACHAAACALPPITDFEFAFGGWGGFPLGPLPQLTGSQ